MVATSRHRKRLRALICAGWGDVAREIASDRAFEAADRGKETAVLRFLRDHLRKQPFNVNISGPDSQIQFRSWWIDLVCSNSNERIAVEGKYKILSDGAVPDNRKAAFFDLFKLEQYIASGDFSGGLFLWLTNERSYLRPAKGDSADFSTHQGRIYESGTPLNAKRARGRSFPLPLTLRGNYTFEWIQVEDSDWYYLTLAVG